MLQQSWSPTFEHSPSPASCKGQGLHNLKQMDYKNRPQFSCIPATHMRVLASTTASTRVMVDLLRPRHNQVNQPGCHLAPKRGHVRQGGRPSLVAIQPLIKQIRPGLVGPSHTQACIGQLTRFIRSITSGNQSRALRTLDQFFTAPPFTKALLLAVILKQSEGVCV